MPYSPGTAASILLEPSGLPQAWGRQHAWRILQIGAPDVSGFLHTWANWKADAGRPRMLHYVAVSPAGSDLTKLAADQPGGPSLEPLAMALAAQCHDLTPGFHRLSFEGGQVLLTLCLGELKASLREQRFVADTVFFFNPTGDRQPDETATAWDAWTVKALARCCHRGTLIFAGALAADMPALLQQGGFELAQSHQGGYWTGRYNPRWEPATTRQAYSQLSTPPATCAVVGAGLAGASVAASLARRGWEVVVLDTAMEAAQGASGLPVGLMIPQPSVDDSPRSRISRNGLRMMHQEAARCLHAGTDWAPSGVMQRRPGEPEVWHPSGAWIKPAPLVRAWLGLTGVRLIGGATVTSMTQRHGEWVLWDSTGQELARAQHVVLAAATGTQVLLDQLGRDQPALQEVLQRLPAMSALAGQVSWGIQSGRIGDTLPPFPVNGSGSLIGDVPVEGGIGWFAGATYEPPLPETPAIRSAAHRANFERLKDLLPAVAHALEDQFEQDRVESWRNVRLVSSNRLPVVGPLMDGKSPTLWVCSALGSRGLTLAALCAELLAARLCAEPWPIEATLAASVDSLRSKSALAHKE